MGLGDFILYAGALASRAPCGVARLERRGHSDTLPMNGSRPGHHKRCSSSVRPVLEAWGGCGDEGGGGKDHLCGPSENLITFWNLMWASKDSLPPPDPLTPLVRILKFSG